MNYWETPIDEFYLEDEETILDSIGLLNRKVPVEEQGVSFNLYKDDSKFFQWVIDNASSYLEKHYNLTDCYIDRAWAVSQHYGVNNEAHSHAPFHLAAVYYVNAVEGHPELEIFDPRPPHIFNNVFRELPNGGTMGGCRSLKFKPENHKMIIFPGYLLHAVGTNMLQEPRVCIAMNINVKR